MIDWSHVLVMSDLGGHSDESVHFAQAQMAARREIKEMREVAWPSPAWNPESPE